MLYVLRTFPKLSETFVINEALGMIRRGHDVRIMVIDRECDDLALFADWPELAPLTRRVSISPIDLLRVALGGWTPVAEAKRVRRVWAAAASTAVVRRLGGWQPDVIHAHFANVPALLASAIAHRLGKPWTMMPHTEDYMVAVPPDILRDRVREAACTFAISKFAQHQIQQLTGIPEREMDERSIVVRASNRLSIIEHARTPDPISVQLISVARLVPQKGVDVSIRAFARAFENIKSDRSANPEITYRIVGDGPMREGLEGLVAELGVGHAVTFSGSLSHDEAVRAIEAADIAVLACRIEASGNMDGIPVFLMEAGAVGLPVLSTRLSGIPELVEDGTGGLLVTPDSVDELTTAILRLATNAEMRTQMGRALQQRIADEFLMERQLDRIETRWSMLH